MQNHSDSSYGKLLRNSISEIHNDPNNNLFKPLFSAPDHLVSDIFSLKLRKSQEKEALNQDLNRYYETIYSGCSETYGSHIATGTLPLPPGNKERPPDLSTAYPNIWGSIVCSRMGGEFLNLSTGGASAISILDDYMYQTKKYGAPKNLLVLFPRIDTRLPFVNDPEILISEPADGEFFELDEYVYATQVSEYGVTQKFSKRPHAIQSVMSGTYTSYLNLQAILTLELLCTLSNTNLIYSTWSLETAGLIEAANEYASKNLYDIPFKNYIQIDYRIYGSDYDKLAEDLPKDCHQDLKSHPYYLIGLDNSHMGVHAHRHIAENFIDELTKRGYTATL